MDDQSTRNPPTIGHDRAFSIAGAAEALGVSRWRLQRAINIGEVDTFSFADGTFITRAEVRRLLKAWGGAGDDPDDEREIDELLARV